MNSNILKNICSNLSNKFINSTDFAKYLSSFLETTIDNEIGKKTLMKYDIIVKTIQKHIKYEVTSLLILDNNNKVKYLIDPKQGHLLNFKKFKPYCVIEINPFQTTLDPMIHGLMLFIRHNLNMINIAPDFNPETNHIIFNDIHILIDNNILFSFLQTEWNNISSSNIILKGNVKLIMPYKKNMTKEDVVGHLINTVPKCIHTCSTRFGKQKQFKDITETLREYDCWKLENGYFKYDLKLGKIFKLPDKFIDSNEKILDNIIYRQKYDKWFIKKYYSCPYDDNKIKFVSINSIPSKYLLNKKNKKFRKIHNQYEQKKYFKKFKIKTYNQPRNRGMFH